MNVLVAVAHPDDETLGVRATIAKHAARGDTVFICIFADGVRGRKEDYPPEVLEKQRRAAEKACDILGVKEIFFLGLKDQQLDTYPQLELNKKLEEIIRKVKPEVVYIPHYGDVNTDHRRVCEATLVATRPFASSVSRVLSFEVLSSTEWNAPGRNTFTPNIYENVEKTFQKKLDALKCYTETHQKEIKDAPYPRSLEIVEALAKKRGSEAGYRRAEAFYLIRDRRD